MITLKQAIDTLKLYDDEPVRIQNDWITVAKIRKTYDMKKTYVQTITPTFYRDDGSWKGFEFRIRKMPNKEDK